MKKVSLVALGVLLLVWANAAMAGSVLDRVRGAHTLACGVIKEEEDYSRATDHGNRAAFDLDMCKAIAVAALGTGAHFTISVFPDEPAAVKALRASKIDLLPSASPTLSNTTAGLSFSTPTFYDGESLMIPNDPAIHSAADLAGKKICFVITSESEAGLRAYAARQHITYIWYPFSEVGEMEAAFFTGNCAGLAGDVSQLANTRGIDRSRAAAYTILPAPFQQDPLAVAYLSTDPQFGAIVDWTVQLLLRAEELGVGQHNLATMKVAQDQAILQLLGQKFGTGTLLGVDTLWGANVLEAVGNYGEMFERDLGAGSPLHLDRGANRLWSDGGLMYPRPFTNE